MPIINTNDENFAENIKGDLVLVDFWAPWCSPCKALSPILNALSDELKGKVKFTKLNIDKDLNTGTRYAVSGIPFLILFKNGEVKSTHVGFTNQESLKKWILSNI